MVYVIQFCCVYSDKTPVDGQRNCPKHVEFYSKNKFENLPRVVGFIIRIYRDAQSSESQIFIFDYIFLFFHFRSTVPPATVGHHVCITLVFALMLISNI